jgi:hypothetical protein
MSQQLEQFVKTKIQLVLIDLFDFDPKNNRAGIGCNSRVKNRTKVLVQKH